MKELKRKILAEVADDLEQIESELNKNLTPYLDLVRQTASHILFSGGKRLRPLLTVLCARICGYDGDYDKTFSVIFEYIHAATLLHDDLMDNASLRRGKLAAYTVFGAPVAVLTGDFLIVRALSIVAETGRSNVIGVFARITENLLQGEIHQLLKKGDTNLSEDEYMEIIRRKTAMLIQGACQAGAMISDADEIRETALSDYGFHVGMAFQMADDLLDYVSDTDSLGKNVGADLREGKLTLPLIHALKNATPEDRDFMKTIIRNKSFTVGEFAKFRDLLKTYKGIAHTEKMASWHVEKAKAALMIFESTKTKDTLLNIADYTLHRKS